MTAAVHRTGTPSLSIQPTQNTAPVLEFNCLYTHDIRRKQKRWQDGFLRFHTFNKRVMVYDVPRNFIGDMHWKEDAALQEGDEMTLEKDAVLVQVAESVGRTETDLTELKQSAKKSTRNEGGQKSSSPGRNNVATPSRSMGPPLTRPGTANAAGGNTQLKHRSLNALLGTPKGPIGKATVPTKSPFETRQAAENEEWESGRPPKRSKAESWNVTRTTTPAQNARKEIPLWKRTSEARAKAAKRATLPSGQQKLGTKEVIDLSDDGDDSPSKFLPGFSSDAIGPASSPVREIPRPPPAQKQTVRSSSPAFETQNLAKAKRREAFKTHLETPSEPVRSPEAQLPELVNVAAERAPSPPIAPPFLPPPSPMNKPSQTLRIASSAPKRKTLACLDQIGPSSNRLTERQTTTESGTSTSTKRKTQKELLEERLAKMKKMAKQKADDLNAIIDDADATAFEINQMDQAPLPPLRTGPPSPLPPQNPAPGKQDRAFQRVVSERGTTASAATLSKHVPGAPVRFTPSPTMRAAKVATEKPRSESQSAPHPSNSLEFEQPIAVAAPVAQTLPANPVQKQTSMEMGPPAQKPSAAPKETAEPARRRPGIGRKEIRKSAQACFPTALNVAASGTSTVVLAKPFQAPKPPAQPKPGPTSGEAGPWTREAFDLFDWRPPGWDEEKWCVRKEGGSEAS